MYYCTLRELVLYLHKDEHGFRNDSLHNAIRIHHALATKATDYTKKQHVFRLQTADQAEYLFQTRLVLFIKFKKCLFNNKIICKIIYKIMIRKILIKFQFKLSFKVNYIYNCLIIIYNY